MIKITLNADKNIQKNLETIVAQPHGRIDLTVIVDKHDESKNQHFSIVQLHDIDTEHPEDQRYDLHYLDSNDHISRDLDFTGLSGAIEYAVFMPW